MHACVVDHELGAGLATAVVLAERGVQGIELIAHELPGETSEGSGAMWRPVFYEGDADGSQVRRLLERRCNLLV